MSRITQTTLNKLSVHIDSIETDSLLVIVDKKVSKKYSIDKILFNTKIAEVIPIELKGSEKVKTYKSFAKTCEYFIRRGVHRKSHILAIGGGSISDFSGYIASSLLRGISWSVVPTTLLSMVDAGIGGKTGINSKFGKNLIGSFHMPDEVFICPEFLSGLPQKEHDSGRGEILKYAYLDQEINNAIESKKDIGEIITLCANYKEKVVQKDFKEGGLRKILNFGHSFGHAYEKMYGIPHGIAVMWGILTMEVLAGSDLAKFKNLCKSLDLSKQKTPWSKIHIEEMMDFVSRDKKVKSRLSIDLVEIKEIGNPEVKNHKLTELKKYFEEKKNELEKFSF